MKILVTGGAGFIGSHLCDHLLAWGDEVHALDNLSLGRVEHIAHHLDNRAFRFIQADLLDVEALSALFARERYEAVFHMAANSDIRKGSEQTDLDLRQTFLTTFHVADCARRFGVREIIFPSSSTVYGAHEAPLSETTGPMCPASFYGAAKLASEAFLCAHAAMHGISVWIFRLPNVVGERLTHGCVYDFVHRLKQDPTRLVVFGDGRQSKPYAHVKDVIDGMMLGWEHSHERVNLFNLGGEETLSVGEIARIVADEMGLAGARIEYTGEAGGWLGDITHFRYDARKIRSLGWKPRHTAEEAIRAAVRDLMRAQPPANPGASAP
ncbi:MAG: SDR family NAD(P)-dependent oxidoreductase [Candidatus Sumerlaeia bacterium]|nr:SDR family NAD(P)-dependent oxidoreductase [Candidatus Sumerlaeia bacterium]